MITWSQALTGVFVVDFWDILVFNCRWILNNWIIRLMLVHFMRSSCLELSCRNMFTWFLGASEWAKACTLTRSYTGQSSWVAKHNNRDSAQRGKHCDVFSGRWVYDNVSYPLYNEATCRYMSDQLACTKHGRPDTEYQKQRWQPHNCDLKR